MVMMAPLEKRLTTLTLLFVCFLQTNAQNFQSPCPELFTYDSTTNETDRWFGALTLRSESNLLDIWLRLTFDRPSLQLGNWFGQVETDDGKDYQIKKNNFELQANVPETFRFFLKYNANLPAPRLLSFRLNGKLVCPEEVFSNITYPNIPLNTNNGVNTRLKDTFQSSHDQNSQSGTNIRDQPFRASTEKIISGRDRINNKFDINSRDRNNSQVNNVNAINSKDRSVVNSRDKVNLHLQFNNRDKPINSLNGVSTESIPKLQDNFRFSTEPTRNITKTQNIVFPNQDNVNIELNDRIHSGSSDRNNFNTETYFTSIQATSKPFLSQEITRDNICGTVLPQARPLIAYGEMTIEGEFPWHSAVYITKRTNLVYICAASLISKEYILTTAHCVLRRTQSRDLESRNPNEFIIQFGKHSLNHYNVGYQDRLVSKVIPHPQFNPESYQNDIALLKLATPANITDYVRYICLWQEETDINSVLNQIGKVVGWGFDEAGRITEELMQANMPIIPKHKCISSYPDFYTRFTSPNTYCAGFANGTSPCTGDSGGGMFFPILNSSKRNPVWHLRGIVSILPSFQNACDITHYTVFTDVAQYLDWIEESMK